MSNGAIAGLLCFVVVPLLVCGLIGALIGSRRCAARSGFAISVLLGPIGWIVAGLIDERPRCGRCRSRIEPDAEMCPYCRADFRPRAAVPWPADYLPPTPQQQAAAERAALEALTTAPADSAQPAAGSRSGPPVRPGSRGTPGKPLR